MHHDHEIRSQEPLSRVSRDEFDVSLRDSGNPVCYHQNCPVCGRNLRIRVTLLGRTVYCQHCGGGFIATDAVAGRGSASEADRPSTTVVDQLIERAAVMLGQSGE